MGLGYRTESSPVLGMIVLILCCTVIACIERQETSLLRDGVKESDNCAVSPLGGCRTRCQQCIDCRDDEPELTQCVRCTPGKRRANVMKHGNSIPDVEPQGLAIACMFQCLTVRRLPVVMLILATLYVLKSKVTRKVSSKQEDLSPVEEKKPRCEDLTDANDFLREVASLYQEAVREVDFATFGRRVGLSDYQIQEIVNNQAEELRGEAKVKYHDWHSAKCRQNRDDLRDDIVAERIKLLPDILVQYKKPQRRVAYAG